MKIRFDKERETKNAVRYQERGEREEHMVGSLYLKKTLASELGKPESVEIEVQAVKD